MNYYKHHIGDYAAATAHLTWDEDMAYTRLLRLYYRDEKPLPADIATICKKAKAVTKPQKTAVENVLREFFSLCATGWVQGRAEKEVNRKKEISEANRMIALERESTKRARLEHETFTPPDTERAPSHKPLANSQEKEEARKRATSPRKTSLPEDFAISERVKSWASEKGHSRLAEHLEAFKSKARANGYTYANWDDAFMEAVRGNWAKLDASPTRGPTSDGQSPAATRRLA